MTSLLKQTCVKEVFNEINILSLSKKCGNFIYKDSYILNSYSCNQMKFCIYIVYYNTIIWHEIDPLLLHLSKVSKQQTLCEGKPVFKISKYANIYITQNWPKLTILHSVCIFHVYDVYINKNCVHIHFNYFVRARPSKDVKDVTKSLTLLITNRVLYHHLLVM